MTIRKALRFEILRRDNFTCTYCGAQAPDTELHIDHVIPESLGGQSVPTNLTTACPDCNAGKGARSLDGDTVRELDQRAQRWASAMALAAKKQRDDEDYVCAVGHGFLAEWQKRHRNSPAVDDQVAGQAVIKFYDAGLTMDDLWALQAVAARAGAVDPFRYFCGCCYKRLEQRRDIALDLIDRGVV